MQSKRMNVAGETFDLSPKGCLHPALLHWHCLSQMQKQSLVCQPTNTPELFEDHFAAPYPAERPGHCR